MGNAMKKKEKDGSTSKGAHTKKKGKHIKEEKVVQDVYQETAKTDATKFSDGTDTAVVVQSIEEPPKVAQTSREVEEVQLQSKEEDGTDTANLCKHDAPGSLCELCDPDVKKNSKRSINVANEVNEKDKMEEASNHQGGESGKVDSLHRPSADYQEDVSETDQHEQETLHVIADDKLAPTSNKSRSDEEQVGDLQELDGNEGKSNEIQGTKLTSDSSTDALRNVMMKELEVFDSNVLKNDIAE